MDSLDGSRSSAPNNLENPKKVINPMSMARTKEHFERLLTDTDVRVLALSGKWGTGKSHMWKTVCEASTDSAIKAALYVSLFGVASISELKLKLVQSAAPLLGDKGPATDAIKSSVSAFKQFGQTFFRAGTALDELALLAVPAFVRDKFIVIDDIERKHAKLSIDEVLGFIDDFTQNYGCRVLLILNTDQLTDKTIWEKLREKVIDEELRLDTTATEAFEIAIQLSKSQFTDSVRPAVEVCGLTNIRIIRKVIRAVNKILDVHAPLSGTVLQRVTPSTVLLSAIHYKGIDDGPTTDYVLSFEASSRVLGAMRERNRTDHKPTDEERLHAKWALLLDRLGIATTDEYEKLVSEYLISGLFNRAAVDAVIDRYRREEELAGAQARARAFFQTMTWNPNLTDADIVAAAKKILKDVPYLDCYSVTALHNCLINLDDGLPIAKRMESAWIERLRSKAAEPGANSNQFLLNNWTGQPLLSSIVAAFEEVRGRVDKPKTLLEVCLYLVTSSGWDSTEESVMRSATVDDFAGTIKTIRGEDLKLFMLKNIDLYLNRATYEKHFGQSGTRFIEACLKIRNESTGTRWAKLIEDLLRESGLSDALDQNSSAA